MTKVEATSDTMPIPHNRTNMMKLLHHLRWLRNTDRANKWDMSRYLGHRNHPTLGVRTIADLEQFASVSATECGTTACFAGHSLLLGGASQYELAPIFAAEWLGIDYRIAKRLFMGNFTPGGLIATLDAGIETLERILSGASEADLSLWVSKTTPPIDATPNATPDATPNTTPPTPLSFTLSGAITAAQYTLLSPFFTLNIHKPQSSSTYTIFYDPKPIPLRSCDWDWAHTDYDGAPDSNDKRCGNESSLEAAILAAILCETDN